MAKACVDFYSVSLMRTVSIEVILPVDKSVEENQEPLKTLYLLHGIIGDKGDWISNTRILKWAQEKNLAVIMPSGENRFYINQDGIDEKYSDFISKELVEITRRMFPLSHKKEDTFIGGLSMGGYGALVNGLNYTETFGSIIALSSALVIDQAIQSKYTEDITFRNRKFLERCFGDLDQLKGSNKDYIELSKQVHQRREFPNLYLACGTEDFLINENRLYHKFLENEGIEHTYVESEGVHDWLYWDKMIKKALEWLPLKK